MCTEMPQPEADAVPVSPATSGALVRIEAVISLAPAHIFQCRLELPQGASLRQAQAAIWTLLPADAQQAVLQPATPTPKKTSKKLRTPLQATKPAELPSFEKSLRWGVWGRLQAADFVLADGDRVEAYRNLTVDPKVARRERFAKQGARGTGLFANQREHAKSGY